MLFNSFTLILIMMVFLSKSFSIKRCSNIANMSENPSTSVLEENFGWY